MIGLGEIWVIVDKRYGLPVMLAETNIKGYVSDRLSWMKHMLEECEKLAVSGADFRGFCWFPFVDSTDWCSLVCRAEGKVDPPRAFGYLQLPSKPPLDSSVTSSVGWITFRAARTPLFLESSPRIL